MNPSPYMFLACFLLIILSATGLTIWQRSAWQKVAEKTGLRFEPNFVLSSVPGKLNGRYQGFEVVLESLSKSSGRSWYYQTRVAVTIRKRSAVYLYLRGQGPAFLSVPELDKTKGIGDQSFSPDFFVICHPTGFAIDLLSVDVQDRLKRELDFGVVVYNDNELSITWPDVHRRANELVQHLDLAVYLAAQIKQLRGYL